jgi:hypothetical protein
MAEENFRDLFVRHICASLEKQFYVLDMLGERKYHWNVDLNRGELHFTFSSGLLRRGERVIYRAEPLGTESDIAGTWLWSWANTAQGLPSNVLGAALEMRDYGQAHEIAELTTGEVRVTSTVTGEFIAAVASGLLDADFYYRCPYDGGTLFVLVRDPSFQLKPGEPSFRAAMTLTRIVSGMAIPRLPEAFSCYLDQLGVERRLEGGRVTGIAPNGRTIVADFDALGRMIDLQAELGLDKGRQS